MILSAKPKKWQRNLPARFFPLTYPGVTLLSQIFWRLMNFSICNQAVLIFCFHPSAVTLYLNC